MPWSFDKYSGCGNDFLLFDNRERDFPLHHIPMLCNRKEGIGADGVLLWENSSKADARMRVFNPDGSEAEMCGNGLRCFVKWLVFKDINYTTCVIEVHNRILKASLQEHRICTELGTPSNLQWHIPFSFDDHMLSLHHVDTGVPHTILFVQAIETVNVQTIGSYIRHSWKPKGTNVTFVQQLGPREFKIRTYERGVEGETLACGTGAAAAAYAASHLFKCLSPLTIETLSNEKLIVDICPTTGGIALTGPACYLFRGEIELNSIATNCTLSVKS